MAANVFVRARIDEVLKNEAASVLAGMGLSVSDLVRITLTKVAREKTQPFDMRIPNELTEKTITAVKKVLTFARQKTQTIFLINRVKLKTLMTLLINDDLPLP